MSEPNSTKGSLFKEKLNATPIKYRDCEPEELVIADCLQRINQEIGSDSQAILIGSSLGGFLAAKTALDNSDIKQIILLNPAVIPPDYDITKIKDMPHRILVDMKEKRLFAEKIKAKIFILIGSNDIVVPKSWPIAFAKAQEATVRFLDDDHSFTNKIDILPSIISQIIGEKH